MDGESEEAVARQFLRENGLSAPERSLEAEDPTAQLAKAPLPISARGAPNPDAFGLGVAGSAPYG
ncbi:MAG TPA: hypothetical protein VGB40_06235, partial [Rubrobacteraceae bacterium]